MEAGSGWAKIRLGEDRSGWVLERYLTEEAPPASKAEALLAEQVRLKKAIEQLKTLNTALKPGRAVTMTPTTGSEPAPLAPPRELSRALELARRLIDREAGKPEKHPERDQGQRAVGAMVFHRGRSGGDGDDPWLVDPPGPLQGQNRRNLTRTLREPI